MQSFGASTGQPLKFKQAIEASLHQRVDPALTRHFVLLRRSHGRGSPGLTHADVVSLIEPNPLGLNTGKERFVSDRSGPAKVFVIPGSQGIALRWVSPGVGQAEGGTEAALTGSLFVESGRVSGHRTIIGLAPDGNRTVRVLLADGRSRLAQVVDNVYSIVVPVSARAVVLRNASGRTVHVHLA